MGRVVLLKVFQLIISGNKLVTTNHSNRLITAGISDHLPSLSFVYLNSKSQRPLQYLKK